MLLLAAQAQVTTWFKEPRLPLQLETLLSCSFSWSALQFDHMLPITVHSACSAGTHCCSWCPRGSTYQLPRLQLATQQLLNPCTPGGSPAWVAASPCSCLVLLPIMHPLLQAETCWPALHAA